MKRNLIAAVVALFLFGIVALAMSTSKKETTEPSSETRGASVKICPHSGLPCEGDGDCDEESATGCEEDSCH